LVAAPQGETFFNALKSAGMKFFPLPFKNVYDIGTAVSLSRIIRSEGVSLVHAHLGISTALSLAASRMSGQVPVLATRHFIEDRYTTVKSKILYNSYKRMYSAINKRLSRVIFVSEAVRRGIESREGPLGNRGIVIPNGIELPERPTKRELTEAGIRRLREKHGVPEGAFMVATLSRLVAEKDLDVLLDAVARLKGKGYYFVIAGDGPLRGELLARARKLNIDDMVRFAGYVEASRELVAAADAFVLVAHAEPFGISIIEAMACGTPVVAARAGGPLEIIEENKSGLFFEPGEYTDLSGKLETLKRDEKLSARLAAGALERVRNYDVNTIVERIQSVYDDILSQE